MATYPPPTEQIEYHPSEEQFARDAELRRFNRFYLYLPLGIVILIALVLIGLLTVGVFATGNPKNLIFVSALADIIVILGIIPMLVIMAILPIAYLGYLVNKRQKRKQNPQTGPLAYRSRVQIFLWRLDSFSRKIQYKTKDFAPKAAEPIIKANATITYLQEWPKILKKQISRSEYNDTEQRSDAGQSDTE